ncbi:DUF1127 domain-containing protein [Sneathiella marina]|uniref:DUF1127 domain-containing protein n=1 Tax=Sneathiella marina TaxID=2950108 RepID=A0ABY4VZR1_9PROT|nr:DUF1127 domain-containing protein [Sneathiella marina]USG60388.1 DUF1127 domain-containing protein [Sneathiella marina]
MMNYNQKELEALAMIQPVQVNKENVNVDALIYRGHVLRSEYISNGIASLYNKVTGKFAKSRQIAAAKRSLYAMSDRELVDLGITRSEIDYAVEGRRGEKPAPSFWASFKEKLVRAQKARAGYAQLMAMDARQLADIGLVKGDIEAAVHGNTALLANDNLAQASNNNEHRHAV